ncbi:MAG TPA: heavy-metal-associated domain-containing protein [Croceibacterium sp.]|nr:heavy-metal-associated domain-containing protein [Croceibacterium sp.]
MASLPLSQAPRSRRLWYGLSGAVALALGAVVWAQVSGDRGIAPVASSTDIEVHGIKVDVTGKNPEDARLAGWKEAQRLAWKKLGGPDIPDGQLQGLVSAIIVQQERLGPRRYIATLGVIFDRARAGGLLGGGDGERSRSAPMLTLPVLIAGGTQTMFEVRNPWQRAWAETQFGASAIDYVRPSGGGGESLLLTYGQTGRRSRAWWTGILDEFGAADVLIPIANLTYAWPGGPVEGHFTARYGPDSKYLGEFRLRAASSEQLPEMLDQAVRRFDAMFTSALASGILRPDPTLRLEGVQLSPEVVALIEAARRAEEADAAQVVPSETGAETPAATPTPTPDLPQALGTFTVQVATPDGPSFDTALGSVRGAAGVRSVAVSSTAIGGTSVLRVTYLGDINGLANALRAVGWRVTVGSGALAIAR